MQDPVQDTEQEARAKAHGTASVADEPPPEKKSAQPAPKLTEADSFTQARQFIMKAANLYILCMKASNKVVAPHVPLIAQTTGMFQSITGSLFIEACRAGLVRAMPHVPLEGSDNDADKTTEWTLT